MSRERAEDLPDEDALLAGFEDRTWPLEKWNHRAHLTVAWMLLARHGLDDAIDLMRAGIQAYNAEKGLPDELDEGYHETLTRGWLHVLWGLMQAHGPSESAAAFLEFHPYLLERLLLRMFYSRPRIMSWEAKRGFVEPDLAPFPTAPLPPPQV